MSKQRHTAEQIISKLREGRGLAGEGDADSRGDASAWHQ